MQTLMSFFFSGSWFIILYLAFLSGILGVRLISPNKGPLWLQKAPVPLVLFGLIVAFLSGRAGWFLILLLILTIAYIVSLRFNRTPSLALSRGGGFVLLGLVLLTVFLNYLAVSGQGEKQFFVSIHNYQLKLDGKKHTILVGTSPSADIVLRNRAADTIHAQLQVTQNKVKIKNCSSRKRLLVNGRDLNQVALKKGDVLKIRGKSYRILVPIRNIPLYSFITLKSLDTGRVKHIGQWWARGFNTALVDARQKKVATFTFAPIRIGGIPLPVLYALFMLLAVVALGIRLMTNRSISHFMGVLLAFCSLLVVIGWFFPGKITIRYSTAGQRQGNQVMINNVSLNNISRTLPAGKPFELLMGYTPYRVELKEQTISFKPKNGDSFPVRTGDGEVLITDGIQETSCANIIELPFPHRFSPVHFKANIKKENFQKIKSWDGKESIQLNTDVGGDATYRIALFVFFLLSIACFVLFRWTGVLTSVNILYYIFFVLFGGIGLNLMGGLARANSKFAYLPGAYIWKGLVPAFIVLTGILLWERLLPWFIWGVRVGLDSWKWLIVVIFLFLVESGFSLPPWVLLLTAFAGILVIWFSRNRIASWYVHPPAVRMDMVSVLGEPVKSLSASGGVFSRFLKKYLMIAFGVSELLTADILFFLVMLGVISQWLLGKETGIHIAGFTLQIFEFFKIVLAVYLADWTWRQFENVQQNTVTLYLLLMVPMALLAILVHDVSPTFIFAIVFAFHFLYAEHYFTRAVQVFIFIATSIFFLMYLVRRSENWWLWLTISSFLFLGVTILRLWREHNPNKIRGIKSHQNKKAIFRWVSVSFITLILLLIGVKFAVNHYDIGRKLLGSQNILRIENYLNPWTPRKGREQTITAMWYMNGSGSGDTIGEVRKAFQQAYRVPRIQDDMVFALFVRAYGMVGVVNLLASIFLLFIYSLILWRWGQHGMLGANKLESQWNGTVILFVSFVLLAQFIIPMASTIGLFPLMGQPLPFFAMGNSALVLFSAVAFGLLIKLSSLAKEAEPHV